MVNQIPFVIQRQENCSYLVILLHEKFLQSDWLRAVVFQLNLKYLHVKITKPFRVVAVNKYTLFFYKNVVFPGQAEYSYFSADFRL